MKPSFAPIPRRRLSAGLITGLLVVVLLGKNCTPGPARQTLALPTADSPAWDAAYLGDATCRSCHAEAYEAWHGSHHFHAMEEANDTTVLGNFDDQVHTSRGVRSRFFRANGQFMVNTQGPDGAYHDYAVRYTFGYHPLQQYLVAFPGGRMQALRVAWDSDKGRWMDLYPDLDIDPGEWLHWSRGGLNWNTMCAECHSTNLKKNYLPEADSFHTTWSLLNVNCEACHGPGKTHLDYVQSPDYAQGERVPGSYLSLTAQMSSTAQVDACGRCHARRAGLTPSYDHQGSFLDHFVPELLLDGTYFSDGQILDEDYVYGSFVQSQMYHEGVACSNCHEPHSLKLLHTGNQLCMQCHEPKYDSPDHHFHARETAAAQCVNCHMTGRYYMVNDFRRDHSFRIPRPDQSAAHGTPNACNGCHTDQSARWAADQIADWYGPERAPHFSDALTQGRARVPEAAPALLALIRDTHQPAIARATALTYLSETPGVPEALDAIVACTRDSAALVRHTATGLLAGLSAPDRVRILGPLLADTVRAVRLAAATALVDASSQLVAPWAQAQRELETYLAVRADFRAGQLLAGQYHERRQQWDAAEQAYLRALRMDSLYNASRLSLATLYNRLGRNTEAERLLRTVIDMEPAYGPAYYSLGLLLAEQDRLAEAERLLAEGAQRTGNNPRMYFNWGLSLQHLGRPSDAERAYLAGLRIASGDAGLHEALAILYLQQQAPGRARPHVEQLLRYQPDNPQYQQLAAQVQSAMR
ncbi:MAG: tetratricopeptide repeat protein [Bacteroidia bacterium]